MKTRIRRRDSATSRVALVRSTDNATTFDSDSSIGATSSVAGQMAMSEKIRVETLVKTIDRAIEQAKDLGLAFAVHLLMIARLEVDQTEIRILDEHRDDILS